MKNARSKVIITAAVSIILELMVGSASRVYAEKPNPGVIPPNAEPFGRTYEEWSAKWWQWTLSLPVDQNPSFDEGGACTNGANGQRGPVWFLTGVINQSGSAERNCTVPIGKALFFPIINVECSTLEAPPFHGDNKAQLRRCAKGFRIANVSAEIDGVAVPHLDRYRVESPLFTFTVPPSNVLGVAAGTGQSVSNGYYLMLAPLSAGKHVIHFSGAFPDFPFTVGITYTLTVAPMRP